MPARDSLTAWLRFGRRVLPRPSTPFELARNLAGTAVEAARLLPQLTGGPVPEEPRATSAGPARAQPERRQRAVR
jgi:hypothetical protein